MGQVESFSFDKGINRKKSRLLLEPGEVYSCSGFGFANDGVLTARTPKTRGIAIDTASTSRINGIHRYGDSIYGSSKALCPGIASVFATAGLTHPTFNYLYYRGVAGSSYANIDILNGNTRPRFADYENFTFVVDGNTNRAYYQEKDYKWGIDGPTTAPTVVVGAAGNPDATYDCYYTFYVTFPNDKIVETAPSPVGTVVATLDKIEWSGIQICPYEGQGLTIYRRLYRTVSGVPYLVDILTDNTTTTYSDNVTDTALQLASILWTEGYAIPPSGITDICVYLQRMFYIKGSSLGWSEPYQPFNLIDTSDVVVTKDNEPLVSLVDWGDQLYLTSASRWYRLQGTDPDTWAIKRTFADNGIVNKHTLKRTKYGLIGLWYDGIYNFDGNITRNITDKKLGRTFFTGLSDLSVCYAEFDGTRYYFYYASSGTTVDSCLVIDFAYYPDYRIYHDDFVAHSQEYYRETGVNYTAKSGYDYTDSGTETIPTSVVTGDKVFGAITKRKCLDYLYYDIDTNSKNVTVNILADGTTVDSLTLNHSTRERNRSRKLKAKEGYRFSVEISCADSQGLDIYAPWILEATPVGE